jgi:hypothetical protein
LDRWLERLGPQPDLLQRALNELNRHEEETPPASEPVQAEYATLLKRLDPEQWHYIATGYSPTAGLERDLLGLSLLTPWERERAIRVLHALTKSRLREAETPYWQLPLQARTWDRSALPAVEANRSSCFLPDRNRPFPFEQWSHLLNDSPLLLRLFAFASRPQEQAFSLCRVRAARLKLALALYQIHEREPAPALGHLVPRYLEALPEDPFSGNPFDYRISNGEQLAWDPGTTWADTPAVSLASGQGVFWSVGPAGRGLGMLFIVPSWPK